MDQDVVALFNRSWITYAKVVAANYMKHAEFQVQSREVLAVFDAHPFSILDLGCGDASSLVPVLNKNMVSCYVGVDLSESALAIAQHNLAYLGEKATWIQADLARLDLGSDQKFEVIYSSFAIHHLQDAAKRELYTKIYNHLEPGGYFIYIDIYHKPGDNPLLYRTEYCEWIDRDWAALTASEKQDIKDHIATYDFPASRENTQSILDKLGLRCLKADFNDPRHYFMVYQKGV
jgi:SAM-dependent methyltransferase